MVNTRSGAAGDEFVSPAEPPRLGYHFLIAVDVERFSQRATLDQVRIQNDLRMALEIAAAATCLDRDLWTVQVTGDGELAILPPGVDAPRLVADYPRELARALALINRARGPASQRLRIRLALHHGPVAAGLLGPVGPGPILVSRLIELDAIRRELKRRKLEDLALIVSASLFRDVIMSRFCGLDPNGFFRVERQIKGVTCVGYIRGIREAYISDECGSRS